MRVDWSAPSEKVAGLLGARPRLETFIDPPHVMIWLLEDNAERVHVMVEVGAEATHASLRKAIPHALLWRDRVLGLQGPRYWRVNFLERLVAEHKGVRGVDQKGQKQEYRKSYAELAQDVNQSISRALRLERRTGEPPAAGAAEDMLEALGFKKAAIRELISQAQKRMDGGQDPFKPGQPVTLQKMADALRAHNQSPTHRVWVQATKVYLTERLQPNGKRN